MTAKRQTRTRTRAHAIWVKAFLTQLSINGNVSAACDAANISRDLVYDKRKDDPVFKAQWDTALEIACDSLEAEAWRRAVNGVNSAIYSQGKYVADEVKYSDTLMQTLLKAHRPAKYRETINVNIPPEALKLLPALAAAINSLNLNAVDVFQEIINEAAKADAELVNG